MNLTEIEGHVTGYLLDVVASTNLLVVDLINKAVTAAERRPHNFRFMETQAQYTTGADVQLLSARPALWKKDRMKPWLSLNDGTRVELEWVSEQEAWRWYPLTTAPTTDNGQPLEILVTDENLYVYPEPGGESDWGDGDYRVVIPYYTFSEELVTSSNETNWWTDNAPWYLIFYAVAEGMVRNREENRAAIYASKAEKEYQEARMHDGRSKLPDRLSLVPRRGSFGRIRPPRRL